MAQHKFNAHAPIFVPGQPWVDQNQECRSLQAHPVVNRGIVPAEQSRTTTSFLEHGSSSRSMNDTVDNLDDTDLALRKLRQWIRYRPRSSPQLDNTVWAIEARFVFDQCFGIDASNLRAWQDLCFFCGQAPYGMPTTIFECRKWLSTIFVNIFDLVEAVQTYTVVDPYFDNASELEMYSRQTGKICPASAATGNAIFGFMLRKWFW